VTKTINAGGSDEHGNQVASGPNPQIGPFYIEGAEPGDVLVVRFEKIESNRDSAYSSAVLAPYAADPAFLRYEGLHEQQREIWHLVNEKIFSALRHFRKTAEDRGVSMGSLTMAWALANPLTTAIITGPRRPEHLDMAEAALEIELSEDERTDLAATFTG